MVADFLLHSLPPTVNNLYGYLRRTVYKKPAVRKWQNDTISQLRSEWNNKPPLSYPLEIHIVFTAKDHKKWDLDNRIKPLQDCLERAKIIENDNQIEALHVCRFYDNSESTRISLSKYSHEEK